jgi:hypothetical protein
LQVEIDVYLRNLCTWLLTTTMVEFSELYKEQQLPMRVVRQTMACWCGTGMQSWWQQSQVGSWIGRHCDFLMFFSERLGISFLSVNSDIFSHSLCVGFEVSRLFSDAC